MYRSYFLTQKRCRRMICGKRKTFNSGIYFRSKVNALQGSGSNFSYWIAGWAFPRLWEAFEETRTPRDWCDWKPHAVACGKCRNFHQKIKGKKIGFEFFFIFQVENNHEKEYDFIFAPSVVSLNLIFFFTLKIGAIKINKMKCKSFMS